MLPLSLLLGMLRIFSVLAAIAALGGLLMQQPTSRFICFVVLPILSVLSYLLAGAVARLMNRLSPQ